MNKNNTQNLQQEQNKKLDNIQTDTSKGSSNVVELSHRYDSEIETAKATASKLNIPFVDPIHADIEPAAVDRVDADIAFETQSIPVRLINDTMLVAMATPDNEAQISILKLFSSCNIRPAAAPKSSVSVVLQELYGRSKKSAFRNTNAKMPMEGDTRAFIVSIISNKGGVGKTHLSINVAYALGKTGAKVLLIDADLGNADISNKLGIFPKQSLQDFLEKKQQMRDIVIGTDFYFDLICSKFGDFKLANLNYQQKIKFIKHFKSVSMEYDFVIFDLGAGISRTVLDFALAADRTIIVTTPQDIISGYACAKASFFRFKEIEERLEERIEDYKSQWRFAPMMVINQVNHLDDGHKLHSTINKTANEKININEGQFRMDIEYLGGIPYDRKSYKAAELKRKPLVYDAPHAMASQCIQHISKKFFVSDGCYDSRVKLKSPFSRFVSIFTQKI